MAAPEPPQTPHRRTSSASSSAPQAVRVTAEFTYRAAAGSAPAGSPANDAGDEVAERSFSSAGDESLTFSSDGSILYHPRKSDSSFASSFEVLSLTDSVAAFGANPSPTSSSPGQDGSAGIPPSPARTMSPLVAKATDIAPVSSGAPEGTLNSATPPSGLLNPAAPTFATRPWYARNATPMAVRFATITRHGKDANGDLTRDARKAMESLGLKPIASLHGTPLLPYSRNPSGSDAFRFTRIADDEIEYYANLRAAPLPLPGNARYTPAGRQVLAKQRNASAPAGKAAPTSSQAAAGISRRTVTAPSPSATFPSHPAASLPTAAAFLQQHQHMHVLQRLQHQAHEEAWARQASLAQQAQLTPPFLPFSPALASPISPASPMVTGDSYAFDASPVPFSPPFFHTAGHDLDPSFHAPYAWRRPSIVVSPTDGINFVDSSTLLELATQQSVGYRRTDGSSTAPSDGQPNRLPGYDAVSDVNSDPGRSIQAGEQSDTPEEQAAFATSASTHHRPGGVDQPAQYRHSTKHRPTLSDATVTAQTYVEHGRRKSATAWFPPPGGMRKSSFASLLPAGPRHVSSAANIQYTTRSAKNSPAPSRRPSIVLTTEPSSSSSSGVAALYRPPMRRDDASQRSMHPTGTAPNKFAARAFSDVGNVASKAKVGAYAAQLETQGRRAASQPEGPVPSVQLEPPTPKPPRMPGHASHARRGSVVTKTSGLPPAIAPPSPGSSSGATVTPSDAVNPGEAHAPGGAQPRRKTRWKPRHRRAAETPAVSSSSSTAAP
ncbi:hypothetical protein JCM3770_002595 [Rhodotorula araucariae]